MPPRHPSILSVCGLFVVLALAAQAEMSENIRTKITAALPKFVPQPPDQRPSSSPVGTPAPLSDDPLVTLPAYHIREKNVPDKDADMWMSRRALDRKALGEYRDTMTDLEWILNCWYIPFLTPSPQARANARYANNKIMNEQQRLTSVAQAIAQFDPVEAKKLLHDLDLSSHPGR